MKMTIIFNRRHFEHDRENFEVFKYSESLRSRVFM